MGEGSLEVETAALGIFDLILKDELALLAGLQLEVPAYDASIIVAQSTAQFLDADIDICIAGDGCLIENGEGDGVLPIILDSNASGHGLLTVAAKEAAGRLLVDLGALNAYALVAAE